MAVFGCVDRCPEPSARSWHKETLKMHIRKEMLDPSLKLESHFVVAG